MNPVSLSKFAQFFAIYLSNTSFNWPWNRWYDSFPLMILLGPTTCSPMLSILLSSLLCADSSITSVRRARFKSTCPRRLLLFTKSFAAAWLLSERNVFVTLSGHPIVLPLYEQLYKRVPVMNLKTLYPPMEDAKEIIRAFLNEKESSSSIFDLVRVLLYTYVELYSQNIRVEVLNEMYTVPCERRSLDSSPPARSSTISPFNKILLSPSTMQSPLSPPTTPLSSSFWQLCSNITIMTILYVLSIVVMNRVCTYYWMSYYHLNLCQPPTF